MSKGLKRICMNCGMRFYDLDKSPIICPSCSTEFTGEEKAKPRRGRASAVAEAPVKKAAAKNIMEDDEDDIEDIDPDDDIVSLDDVDEDDDEDEDDTLTIDSDPDDLDDDLDDGLDDIEDEEEDLDEDEDEDEDDR